MRGRKSTYEEKELMGTVNKSRDKKGNGTTDPEIAEYLNKIKGMLDTIWNKLNDPQHHTIEELEKYSKLFIMWQKHYFTYKSLAPKDVLDGDVMSDLISAKTN